MCEYCASNQPVGSREKARQYCESRNSILAIFAVNTIGFVRKNLLSENYNYAIGLSRNHSDSEWMWSNGDVFTRSKYQHSYSDFRTEHL